MGQIQEFPRQMYADSLAACESEGCHALFMPDVARARIAGDLNWYTAHDSVSVCVTGKTRRRDPVILYVHMDHPLATAEGLRRARKQGLVDSEVRFPQEAFWQLLDRHDRWRVKAESFKEHRASFYGSFTLEGALNHPQTIPFFGSEYLAAEYLRAFGEANHTDCITIGPCFANPGDTPLARFLFAGSNLLNGFLGSNGFYSNGCIVGVPRER